jgi:protein JSN1
MHNLIPTLSDTPIRIGFGKIDSVPTAQPSASTQQYSLSNSSASSVASQSDAESDSGSLGDEMRSGTKQDAVPTRSLWVGSIPPTITSDRLTSIFSAFGPIESARILPAKHCGFGESRKFIRGLSDC